MSTEDKKSQIEELRQRIVDLQVIIASKLILLSEETGVTVTSIEITPLYQFNSSGLETPINYTVKIHSEI